MRRAARWVWDELGAVSGGDLGDVALVVPGARAGRRLEAMLVEEAGGALLLPRVLTPGGLAEATGLLDGARPVSGLAAAWGRAVAAASLPDASRAALLGGASASEGGASGVVSGGVEDDPLGWLAVGRALSGYVAELATGVIAPGEVAEQAEALGAWGPRYRAAAEAERAYRDGLADRELVDRDAAVVDAARSDRAAWPGTMVLVGVADLRPIDRRIVEAVAVGGARVVALVLAEAAMAEAFDELGGLITERWTERATGLSACEVVRVPRVSDQGAAAVASIDRLSESADARVSSTADVTVGLGDESVAAAVDRAIDRASDGASRGRSASAQTWGASVVGRLIDAVARYSASRRLADLGPVLRHPDVERRLSETLEASAAGSRAAGWPGALAAFVDATLAERWDDTLGADERWASLRAARAEVEAVLPSEDEGGRRRPLGRWADAVRELLRGVYGASWSPRGWDEADRLRWEAIEVLVAGWEAWERAAGALPSVTWPEALRLTLAEFGDRPLTATPRDGDVELVGWLELMLDDAPAAVVCGLTEGAIPSGGVADAWLPDRLRGRLGLVDARRRRARDAYLMSAIVASRAVEAIVPMRGDDGEPLTPSRLLLQGRSATDLAEGVLELFDDRKPLEPVRPIGRHGEASGFVIPRPRDAWSPEDRLRVSDFRLYLQDPYRFYVERVLGLSARERRVALELDALGLGRLLHEAVEVLESPELCASRDVDRLREAMTASMDRALGKRYAGQPVTAVRAQREMMAARLAMLAERQAELAADGWRVAKQEAPVSWAVRVDHHGRPTTVTIAGRIDRVDVHRDGRIRLIDYKTGDTARTPRQTHLGGEHGWLDLQLPLYAEAAAWGAWDEAVEAALQAIGDPAEVELGYILLPKEADLVGWSPAVDGRGKSATPWGGDLLASAYSLRDRLVGEMLAGGAHFWPVDRMTERADAVSAMAGVTAVDRAGLLRQSGWEGGGA
ncbi:MAG: PD-(D/E)XK nuclease family protein [Planctomycetota bacterium]